ncbi:MAG: hypothetical protein J5651_06665 [Salinivirgaceae bacterium]|nr:hypothetical protein [Salinivirgaceae bacterium]
MEKLDKVILGDNQFFGINHRSQEKAEEMLKRFGNIDNIFEVYDNAFECGVKAVMLNSNEKAVAICDRFRAQKSKYGDVAWYPSIPYAYKYANMVNELGIFPAVNEVLFKGNTAGGVLGMIGKGTMAVMTKDAMRMMEMLIDVEYKMFRDLNVKVFFLQNIITDLMLGYGVKEVFEHFVEYIRKKYKVTPGFVTLNLPYLKNKLEEWGIDDVVICSSINAAGFNMHPSKEEYERVIATNDPSKYQLMAMNVLASGSITVQQSFDYINSLNIQSVVFGASSKGHIKSTIEAIKLKD